MPTAYPSRTASGAASPAAGSGVRSAGARAFGRYTILEQLGSGGMADVYLAALAGPFDAKKLVVLKCPRRSSESVAKMFLDEVRLTMRLNHPNVVQTYDVGVQDGAVFLAMEFLEGQSLQRALAAMVRDNRDLPHVYLARIASDALSGLHYAHELRDFDGTPLNIVHRDVSPHNLFLTYDGLVKVLDFGVAKASSNLAQTEAGAVKGKLSYMAPEHALEAKTDRRADVFAMGIVLWEMVAKQRLLTGATNGQVLNRLLNMPFPPLSKVVADVDPQLEAIVARALERDREVRFQTALEMHHALEEYIAGSGQTVRMAELGRFVSVLFGAQRDQMEGKIRTHMVALGARPSAVPDMPAAGSGSAPIAAPTAAPNGGTALSASASGSASGSVSSASGPVALAHPERAADSHGSILTTVRPQLSPATPAHGVRPGSASLSSSGATPAPAVTGSSPMALFPAQQPAALQPMPMVGSDALTTVAPLLDTFEPQQVTAEAGPTFGATGSLTTTVIVALLTFAGVVLVATVVILVVRARGGATVDPSSSAAAPVSTTTATGTGTGMGTPSADTTGTAAATLPSDPAAPIATGVLGASMNEPPPTPAASASGGAGGAGGAATSSAPGAGTPAAGASTSGGTGSGSGGSAATRPVRSQPHAGGRSGSSGGAAHATGGSARPIDTSFPGE